MYCQTDLQGICHFQFKASKQLYIFVRNLGLTLKFKVI